MVETTNKPVDVALFEDGWILTASGELYNGYSQETASCLRDVINTVHNHNAKVFMAIGIVLKKVDPQGATTDEVERYETTAHETPQY